MKWIKMKAYCNKCVYEAIYYREFGFMIDRFYRCKAPAHIKEIQEKECADFNPTGDCSEFVHKNLVLRIFYKLTSQGESNEKAKMF